MAVFDWNDMYANLSRNMQRTWVERTFGIEVEIEEVEMVASSLGCTHDSLPFIYLGLPRLLKSLIFWNLSVLDFFGGFKKNVRGISWVKWGLGVGSLHAKNLGLLGKWKWRFLTEKTALWRKVVKYFYGEDGGFSSRGNSIGHYGTWHGIINAVANIEKLDGSFNSSFKLKISNGSDTLFWKDKWCEDGSLLMDRFPRLFSLDSSADCTIRDRWGVVLLAEHRLGFHHVWNSWSPHKVNICVWRALIDRLPTRANLLSRGVNIGQGNCPFCDYSDETIEHYLLTCPKVVPIWRKLWSWWNLNQPVSFPSFSIKDVSLENLACLGCPNLNKVLHSVFQCSLWAIWKWRNKVVHAPLESRANTLDEDIFLSIQRIISFPLVGRISSWKRFAFVRFIKVINVDRLVENLCTLWIGRMHLHTNVARFDRPPIRFARNTVSRPTVNGASSNVSVLKGNPNTINHISTAPALVLDEECLVERELDNFVLGEVKDFSSINNLLILLSNEGFSAYGYVNGDEEKNADMSKKVNLEDESDTEGNPLPKEKENSSDPFNLYNLLNKHDKGESNFGLDPSIPFPPGFTPADQEIPVSINQREGGSILEIIDDMIKVGQAMGFTMEESKKDMENIIGSQRAYGGFK
nr:RNA-directed DNA polymerase, eukaryota, reverse transcriptase zinc-binding domain protein [Tanacetum cinerariifolium]